MSRRKKIDSQDDEEPVSKRHSEKSSSAGSGLFVMIVIVILLAAGIGSAVYFMVDNGDTGAGIDYGGDSTTDSDTGTGSGDSGTENPIAIINVRSDDGSIAGAIKVELYRDKAPVTVDNFIRYAKDGFYDDLVFHRVIANFVVQGGGFYYDENGDLQYKSATYPPIKNEADNGLSNEMGTIAMARTSDPNSATSQFYFNLVDNPSLDYKDPSNPGYCVFGKVIDGWSIVQQIGALPTTSENGMSDVPMVHVTIEGVTILNA